MSFPTGHRKGGRGCPSCGSHDTEGLERGIHWCMTCNHRWMPCTPGCRGYRLDMHAPEGPIVIGCAECGVPNKTARFWPEAHRALANRLTSKRLDAVVE